MEGFKQNRAEYRRNLQSDVSLGRINCRGNEWHLGQFVTW